MDILDIILIIVVACLGFFSVILFKALENKFKNYLKDNPDMALDFYYESNAVEAYKCTLFLTIKEDSEFDGAIYDFSMYNEAGIISLVDCRSNRSVRAKRQYIDENGDPITGALPNQTVYLMKDGSYEWDVRPVLKELKGEKNDTNEEY